MRLHVVFDARTQRFLSKTAVTVKVKGGAIAETADSKHGDRSFKLPDDVGTAVDLTVEIPSPDPGTLPSPILKFDQPMEVAAGANGKPTLKPAAKGRFSGEFHPRLFPPPTSVNSGGGTVFTINIDLTFLDVTARVGGIGRLDAYDQRKPEFDGKPDHYDVEMRVLEYTKGAPVAWAVFVPPAMKSADTRTAIAAVLFFRPIYPVYKNTDDVPFAVELLRYLGDPPSTDHNPPPPGKPKPGLGDMPFFARGATPGATPPLPAMWKPYPDCGWDRQLAEVNKPFVFIHPLPSGGGFGDAAGATALTLMEAVVRTLWAEGRIGQKVNAGLKLDRIIAGAFSFGGDSLFAMFNALPVKERDRIKELYLFDANGFTANVSAITTWFKTGGKKLRMIGGMLHEGMFNLAKTLGSADATVKPEKLEYWQKDDLFRSAVSSVGDFSKSSASSASTMSASTRMFEQSTTRGDTAIMFEGRDAAGKSVGTVEVLHCSNREAASITNAVSTLSALEKKLKPPPKVFTSPVPAMPVKDKNDLANNAAVLNKFVPRVRHQWVVCGGEDSGGFLTRGSAFEGYLQLCLKSSGI